MTIQRGASSYRWPLVDAGRVIATITIEQEIVSAHDCARSRSHDGWLARCSPAADVRTSIDIESCRNPIATSLARRFGVTIRELLNHWTMLECFAKLADIPVHALLKRYPPGSQHVLEHDFAGFQIRTFRLQSWYVGVGWEWMCNSSEH